MSEHFSSFYHDQTKWEVIQSASLIAIKRSVSVPTSGVSRGFHTGLQQTAMTIHY